MCSVRHQLAVSRSTIISREYSESLWIGRISGLLLQARDMASMTKGSIMMVRVWYQTMARNMCYLSLNVLFYYILSSGFNLTLCEDSR